MKNILFSIFTISYLVGSYCFAVFLLLLQPSIFIVQKLAFFLEKPSISYSKISQATWEAQHIVWQGSLSSTIYTQSEYDHLRDVHMLLRAVLVLGVFSLIIMLFLQKNTKKETQKLGKFFKTLAFFLTGISLFCVLFFPMFFEYFHQLFFPQGNYSFPSDSLLIQSFPLSFWILEFIVLQTTVILFLFGWQFLLKLSTIYSSYFLAKKESHQ